MDMTLHDTDDYQICDAQRYNTACCYFAVLYNGVFDR
jgi:hypothetical protein